MATVSFDLQSGFEAVFGDILTYILSFMCRGWGCTVGVALGNGTICILAKVSFLWIMNLDDLLETLLGFMRYDFRVLGFFH